MIQLSSMRAYRRGSAALLSAGVLALSTLSSAPAASAAALVTPDSPSEFIAGNGTKACPSDGSTASTSPLDDPWDALPDAVGNTYITSVGCNQVFKVDSSGKIWVVAGTGAAGSGGDGSLATAATLCRPIGLALNPAGTALYISEQGASDPNLACKLYGRVVRKVDLASGIISTVAGSPGVAGSTGDNGPAASATFNSPSGLTFDASGNLFIADFDQMSIRRIDGTGTITTYKTLTAGARQVAFDSAGAMYWAQANDHKVFKYEAGSNTTTVIASTGSNSLPEGVAVDGSGIVYVTDRGYGSGFGQSIHQVSAAGGSTYGASSLISSSTTGCGSGTKASELQVSYPWLMHVSSDGKSLLVAIGGCDKIARFGPPVGSTPDVAATVSAPSGSSTEGSSASLGSPAVTQDSDSSPVTFVSPDVSPTCSLYSGTTAVGLDANTAPGIYTTKCSGATKSGYTFTYGDGTWTVNAAPYSGAGYYAPVDAGVSNTLKAGSAVPLKFRAYRLGGEVTDASLITFKVVGVNCSTLTGSDAVEEISAGGTVLRYDSTSRQFIQNWKTPVGKGKCYTVTHSIGTDLLATANFMTK